MERLENGESTEKEREPQPCATIYLVRHGESPYDEERMSPERVTYDLTDNGAESLSQLAKQIDNEIAPGNKVYVINNERVRVKNSADVIANKLKQSGRVVERLAGAKNSTRNWKLYRDAADKENSSSDIYDRRNDDTSETEVAYKRDIDTAFGQVFEDGPEKYLAWLRGEDIPVIENVEEYQKKIRVFLKRLAEIARKRRQATLDNSGVELHETAVVVTNGEWLDSALQIFFKKAIKSTEDGVQRGQFIKMEVFVKSVKFTFQDEQVMLEI